MIWLLKSVFLGLGGSHPSPCTHRFLRELLPSLQSKAQDLGSRKGLLPAGTPSSRASLHAFCMQYCWSSAAAWETDNLKLPCERGWGLVQSVRNKRQNYSVRFRSTACWLGMWSLGLRVGLSDRMLPSTREVRGQSLLPGSNSFSFLPSKSLVVRC